MHFHVKQFISLKNKSPVFPYRAKGKPGLFERVRSVNEYNQGGMDAELLTEIE